MSEDQPKGERIAKVMARAGIASRRDAEKMILDGRVAVNGVKADSPALDVLPTDKVTLDGKPIDAPQPARLWLYYKPVGLVTSAKDEKGRQTVFDTMPEGMPRVMSVGRLDLTSEGLLLLTNDGELKRKLELPTTGWLRKYRVRVNGRPNEATFDPLRRGVTIEGEEFQPMEVTLDKQQGANAWLTVGLREGKNREIRRAMAEVGLTVNRLIRVSYGPFRLNTMKPGDVVEVKQRVLREQLGGKASGEAGDKPDRPARPRRDAKDGGSRRKAPEAREEKRGPRPDSGDKPFAGKRFGGKDAQGEDRPRPYRARAEEGGEAKRLGGKRFGGKDAQGEDRPRPYRARAEEGGEAKRFGGKPAGGKRFGAKDAQGEDRPRPYRARAEEAGEAKRFGGKPAGGRRFGGKDAQGGDRPRPPRARAEEAGEAKRFGGKPAGGKRFGGKDAQDGDRPRPPRARAEEGGEAKRFGGKPAGGKRFGGKDAQDGDRPRPAGKPRGKGRPGDGPGPKDRGAPRREGAKPRGPRKGPPPKDRS